MHRETPAPSLKPQSRFDNFKRLAEAGTLPQHQVDWLISMTSDLTTTISSLSPHLVKRPCEWWAAGESVQQHVLRFRARKCVE
jgi:hypothetical protein